MDIISNKVSSTFKKLATVLLLTVFVAGCSDDNERRLLKNSRSSI